jgi:hypothetical protein
MELCTQEPTSANHQLSALPSHILSQVQEAGKLKNAQSTVIMTGWIYFIVA